MNRLDLELLSAYVDGQLGPSELARIESRLQSETELRSVLDDLRAGRDLLRKLPMRKAPRNFTLSRRLVSRKPPMPSSFSLFQLASAAATLLLLLTVAVNTLTPQLAIRAAAPVPALGMGGGAGPESSDLAATEGAAAEPALEQAFAPTPTEPGQDAQRSLATTAPELGETEGDDTGQSRFRSDAPVSSGWQLVLGVIAIGCAIAAFGLNRSAVSRWRT